MSSVSRTCPTWVYSVFFSTCKDFFHDQYPRTLECLDGGVCHTKVLLAGWFPETTLYLFAPWLSRAFPGFRSGEKLARELVLSLLWDSQVWLIPSKWPGGSYRVLEMAMGKKQLTERAQYVSQQLPTACWSRLSVASDKRLQNTKQVIKTSVQVFPNLSESQKLSLDTNRNFPLWSFINWSAVSSSALWPEGNLVLMIP